MPANVDNAVLRQNINHPRWMAFAWLYTGAQINIYAGATIPCRWFHCYTRFCVALLLTALYALPRPAARACLLMARTNLWLSSQAYDATAAYRGAHLTTGIRAICRSCWHALAHT